MPDTLTEEEIAGHFTAMDHSVNLITAVVADPDSFINDYPDGAAGVNATVIRNTNHLEIQAGNDWYSESSNSKTSYENAVTAGKAYIQ